MARKGYLTLSRRHNEGITLIDRDTGDEIHLILVSSTSRAGRICIKAPDKYDILRDELLTRSIEETNARRQEKNRS